jgi:hypothetical protein
MLLRSPCGEFGSVLPSVANDSLRANLCKKEQLCDGLDFDRWEKGLVDTPPTIAGVPLTRRWLIPQGLRPKLYWDHPVMSAEEIRSRTQAVWDNFYSIGSIWRRSKFIKSSCGRLAFVLISKIYRQMYADTGIATDSARVSWSGRWARWLAKPCRRLFAGSPMPELAVPERRTQVIGSTQGKLPLISGDPRADTDVAAHCRRDLGILCVLNKSRSSSRAYRYQGNWDETGYPQIHTTNEQQIMAIEPSFKEITAWLIGSDLIRVCLHVRKQTVRRPQLDEPNLEELFV